MSEEIAYSFGPSGWCSHRPAYRSSPRVALTAKSGSRREIQDPVLPGFGRVRGEDAALACALPRAHGVPPSR
ncbi:MAG: hypothetical protein ACYCO3_10450 [Mycobacteriales bacterium]